MQKVEEKILKTDTESYEKISNLYDEFDRLDEEMIEWFHMFQLYQSRWLIFIA